MSLKLSSAACLTVRLSVINETEQNLRVVPFWKRHPGNIHLLSGVNSTITALLSDDQWLIPVQPCSPVTAMMLICVAVVSVAVAPVGAGAGLLLGAAFWPSSGPCTSNLSI